MSAILAVLGILLALSVVSIALSLRAGERSDRAHGMMLYLDGDIRRLQETVDRMDRDIARLTTIRRYGDHTHETSYKTPYKKPTEETGLMELEHETEKNAEKREMKVIAPEETKEGRE